MARSFFFAICTGAIMLAAQVACASTKPSVVKPTCSRTIQIAATAIGRSMVIAPDGKNTGTAPEFFDLISKETGCRFEYVPVPRVRAFKMLTQGEIDIVADATRSPDRDEVARFIPLGTISPMLISLKQGRVDIQSVEQLLASSLKVIVIKAYDFGAGYRELLRHPKMRGRVTETLTPDSAVLMLKAWRADALVMSPLTIVDALDRLGSNMAFSAQEIEGMPALSFGEYLSKARLSPADMEVLDDAIQALIARGEPRRLLHAYYPKWAVEHVKPSGKGLR